MTADATAVDVILAVAVVIAGALAVFGRSRIQAAAMFLVFGVLLAVVWARLNAPDVAIAEAVLGAGVTGALLITAVTLGRSSGADPSTQGRRRRAAGGILAGSAGLLVAGVLTALVLGLDAAAGLGEEVGASLESSGVEHPVTAVLLNFRSYDTLLEIAVLAAAAVAALSLTPRLDVPEPLAGSGQAQAMARIVVPILVLAAGWVLVAGSTRPGGAFQAGALLGGAFLMLYLAGTGPLASLLRAIRPVLLAGLAAFIAVALAALIVTGSWLQLDPAWAGGVILALEAVLTVSIGATLAFMLIAMGPADHLPADRGEPR